MIRRIRSSVSGRFVKAATALRHPRTTLVERPRVDDHRVRVDVHALGIVRPGDTLVARFAPGTLNSAQAEHVADELKRWVDVHAPGAEVVVFLGHDVKVTVDRTAADRLGDAGKLLAALELEIEHWEARVQSRPGLADARAYAETLAQGITALGLVLGAVDPSADLEARLEKRHAEEAPLYERLRGDAAA